MTANSSGYLGPARTFTDAEKHEIFHLLATVTSNPYTQYEAFRAEVAGLPRRAPDLLGEIAEIARAHNYDEQPALYFRNCPLDTELPVFDFDDPVASKYALKHTFICEAFLSLVAVVMKSDPLAYRTINNGDVFHDVYLKTSLGNTHSQKSMTSIGFHNDLPNNLVRPRWVNILCVRQNKDNLVSTTFIRNQDIIRSLDRETLEILAEPIFFTEHEVISLAGGRDASGVVHRPIYRPNSHEPFCYFEHRTTTHQERGLAAIAKLNGVLHATKQRLFMEPGDIICIDNNACIHGREVIEIKDKEAHKRRWLLKTWNVDALEAHHQHLLPERRYVVNE